MKVSLLHSTPLEILIQAIRMCYRSEGNSDNLGEKDKALIKRVIASGHESVLEHITYSFKIEGISRVCSHQLIRHRIASYSQRKSALCKSLNLKKLKKLLCSHQLFRMT